MKRRELFSLSLFLTLITIITMDGAIILPNQVLIAADFGFTDVAFINILVGICLLVSGVSVIFFGYLTDIVNRKNLLVFAGVFWAITSILHFYVTDISQLLFLRILSSIAMGVTTPVAFSYLSDVVSSDSRSKAFATWGLIQIVGSLLAGTIALMYNQIPYNKLEAGAGITQKLIEIINTYPDLLDTWRFPFLTLGILALVFAILNLFITTEPKRAGKERDLKNLLVDEELQYSYKIKFSDLKFIYKRKSNLFLIMNLFDVIGTGILIANIFSYINLEMGISFGDPEGLSKIIVLLFIAAPAGLIVGQFGLSHWADKKVQRGDLTGRVRVATICGILNLPFLLFALFMTPNVSNSTFFFNTLTVDAVGFWFLWIIFSILIGIGLAFSLAIGPNWYSSLIDVNLPEHRGTMIAMASFLDTIGRAIGAFIGAWLIVKTNSFAETIFWANLLAGIASTCLWIPLFLTCDKDFNEVAEIMKKRADEMRARQVHVLDKNIEKLD